MKKRYAWSYLWILWNLIDGSQYRPDKRNPGRMQLTRRDPVKAISPLYTPEVLADYEAAYPNEDPLWMEVIDCDVHTGRYLNRMVELGLITHDENGYRLTDLGREVHRTQGLGNQVYNQANPQ